LGKSKAEGEHRTKAIQSLYTPAEAAKVALAAGNYKDGTFQRACVLSVIRMMAAGNVTLDQVMRGGQ
jgi:hypothetical protein